jgi:hypothetical protein
MHSVTFFGAECIGFSASSGLRRGLHRRSNVFRGKVHRRKCNIRERRTLVIETFEAGSTHVTGRWAPFLAIGLDTS